MEVKTIRELSDDELNAKTQEMVETLFNLRFQKETGQLENPRRIRQVRRDLARIKTIQRQRRTL